MNLIKGKMVLSPKERDAALNALEGEIYDTLKSDVLNTEMVLNACDLLSKSIGQEHVNLLVSAGISPIKAEGYLREAKAQLNREALTKRLKTELGDAFFAKEPFVGENGSVRVKERILPLGTLFHIAAGNQFGLAFYSAVEGLLTGNINLIKLPSNDDGLSAVIFSELFKIEPLLKDYVYLFDYTSTDTEAIRKLMKIADAAVIWGGDSSVRAIRDLADPTTKIIEWGHKLSVAYVTRDGYDERALYGLAENIVQTNQLLCSSCQGIYLDTDSMEDVYRFCEAFLPVLEQCRRARCEEIPLEIQAQTGLMVYTERLRADDRPCRVFQGKYGALLAYEDSSLKTAIPYGNCWVKRLPRRELVNTLRPHKSHLQTAGLLCAEEDREALTELLWKAGVIRVTQGKNMSETYTGAAHDGEYALRRYTRIVSQEFMD
ncbi:MAG TPA: acyl-CoA reductase [Oscillospiraceae bacterium]|nr:acyl-CoA reductase [Oscillospiraceae bacterium]HPF56289.1 acyl-CoA reductase [Clostridiales bacterium]HPK35747.1 acyl-CoA reductase [Oscillospiraceae bacterium]HPR75045.1 acyl-CoA reductase [Oscillospiraceae bacterium]